MAASVGQAIRDIRLSLRALERGFGKLSGALARSLSRAKATAGKKLRLSPKRRAALRVHGQYLGFMRNLSDAKKAKVKALKVKKGYPAAIALARKLAG